MSSLVTFFFTLCCRYEARNIYLLIYNKLGDGEDIDRFVMHEECSHEESVIFTVQFFRTFVLNLVSRHPIVCWYLLEIDFLDENTDRENI